jgi:uncharacterized phage protein (TIGR01671 family)
MEREIKFRAWDEANKKMTKSMLLEDLILKASLQNPDTFQWDSEIPMMQYTGLKDKNGVEIYEGDLLRFPPKDDYEKQTYNAFEVFFHGNDAASYHIGWQMNRMHTQGHSAGGASFGFLPKNTAKMEVIGNIHQNPELL